jgi:phage internal scaffolding protein
MITLPNFDPQTRIKHTIYHDDNPPPKPEIDCSTGSDPAQQQFRDECDVNHIMDRYNKTGIVTSMATDPAKAIYGDFSAGIDYQTAHELIFKAEEQFAALPSKIRERFKNDPRLFLEFMNNPENQQEAIKLGLISPPK